MTRMFRHQSAVWFTILALGILQACATANPFAAAKSTEQQALALYGSFTILKEQAAKLYIEPGTSPSMKEALSKANAAVTPTMNLMYESVIQVKQVRQDFASGKTTEEKLVVATTNLLKWYTQAVPLLAAFESEYERVRQ